MVFNQITELQIMGLRPVSFLVFQVDAETLRPKLNPCKGLSLSVQSRKCQDGGVD